MIGVQAREDVTSTYLKDAALENETANWALVNTGGNHNWDGTYKYHESWHNTFSLSQTVTVPNGYYQISIQAVNSIVPSTNPKLTAVSGENNASAYIRHSSAGDFAGISKQFSMNSDACRIYATVKVENGSLTVGFSQTNNNEWVVYGQFKLYRLTETEYRHAVILQNALESNANSWSDGWTNGGGQYSYGRERFNETAYEAGKIIYKTFGNLPLGNYDVTVHAKANVAWREAATGDNIAQVYAGTKTYDIPVEAKTGYDLATEYCYTFNDLEVTTGNLEVGIQNIATGGNWYNVALINLLYKGGCIEADAVALPANGDMTADTWYYFDIAVAGDDYNATATTLGDITCTANGNQLSSSATGEVVLKETENSLSATRYYVKSSSANNLVVEAANYSYDVGAAALSSADGSYTQSQTFTVTFPNAASNDPAAEVAFVPGSKATVNGVEVTLTAVSGGFSLDLGSLTASSNYEISIPEGVYGYAGESMNEAINVTLHTPAVFDGVYYLYDATEKLFLGRGANYSTRAVADKYGVAMTVATNANGISNFTFLDGGGNKLFDANGGLLYTDNTTYPNFAIESTAGGYYVVNKNTTASSTYDGKLYIDGESKVIVSMTNSTVWSLLTDAERDAIVDAYPTDNINTVIAAAGISTTAAEFESFLSTNYDSADKTSLIGTATFAGSVGDWTWAEVKHQDNQPAYGTKFAELWNATGTYSQTIENLPAGIYKLTVDGFERRATVAISNSLGESGYNLVSSYLAANDEQVRLTDWYTTSKPGNTGGAVTAFENGEATNELYIYLDGNTDLDIKLVKPNYVWDCWTIFNNFTLTCYTPKSVSATIGTTGWTTFASPYALDLGGMSASEGTVKAYYASSVGTGKIVMTSTSEGVAAGTGLMLKGTAGAAVTIPVAASGSPIVGNLLEGCPNGETLTANANYYVLINKDGTAEFQSLKTNGATIPAGKAYLNTGVKSSARLIISFDDEDPTAINAIEAAEAEDGALKDGKYLIGNKVVLVKNGVKYGANGQKLN